MIDALLFAAALATAVPAPVDTVVELRRGDRVVVSNVAGDLVIEAWDRDVLEIVGEDDHPALEVRRGGSRVEIGPEGGRRRRRSVDAVIRVPQWADVEIVGLSLDVSVRGLEGELRVGNVSGDIRVRDVAGAVDARSIDGTIEIQDARGGVRASSQSDDVIVARVAGPVEVHSGSGDLVLTDVRSKSVRAETQDGDIDFGGTIADDGSYGFFVHDGDATLALSATTSARVSVSTFDGEFESEFPVVVERFTGGREFEFVLGDGSARIQIEVFDGEIRLLQRR